MTETGDRPSPPRTPSKSAAAFRTISEVATELDLPQHVLRFWETKFNAIKPMKRGGGRRYYRPDDIALLKSIRDLLYDDGYTIKGVQKLLRDGGGRIAAPAAPASVAEAGEAPQGAPPDSTNASRDMAELKSIAGELEDIRAVLRPEG
ncbi:MAG: MerR family transcriptional regulator [Alphaproteobacteria bacterium]